MLGIHDLLLFGYWGVMTEGPQMGSEVRRREGIVQEEREKQGKNYTYLSHMANDFDAKVENGHAAFPALLQTQQAAVDLALLVQDIHPWGPCREAFAKNVHRCNRVAATPGRRRRRPCPLRPRCTDEELVTSQAAVAWSCVGIREEMLTVACDGNQTKECVGKPMTSLRDPENPDAVRQVSSSEPYRNYVINGDAVESPLGVCWQGGPGEQGYATGNTKWLRACSFWTAFHSMALRADALGGDFPNQLFGTIIRLISGGALWCGG
jgi:hypothetical protein